MNTTCGLHCLKLSHISVTRDDLPILLDVNLHAHCGELTAIIGRNGAGKSTLLKAILGEVRHEGSVDFSGHDGTPSPKKPRIGYVPQSLDIDAGAPATVRDVALAYTTRWPAFLPHRRETLDRLAAHFARFGADTLLDKPAGRLSGGEQQRVLLALATIPKPDLLILDEPVSGVDSDGLLRIYAIIEQLRQEDMLVIMVSHDLDYVYHHADRVLLLEHKAQECGTPEQVYATAAFREAFPAFERGNA